MKPHKHAELIKAWADGAKIQRYSDKPECSQVPVQGYFPKWIEESTPQWLRNAEYRIKPEPKPEPVKVYYYIYNNAVDAKTWFSPIHLDYPDSITCQYIGKIEVLK